jgi:hypothetical protein
MRSTIERSRVAPRARPKRRVARPRPGAEVGLRRRRPASRAAGAAQESLPQIDITRALLLALLMAFLTMTVLPRLLELAGAPFR